MNVPVRRTLPLAEMSANTCRVEEVNPLTGAFSPYAVEVELVTKKASSAFYNPFDTM